MSARVIFLAASGLVSLSTFVRGASTLAAEEEEALRRVDCIRKERLGSVGRESWRLGSVGRESWRLERQKFGREMLRLVSRWANSRPLALACATTTAKTTSADLIVQVWVENKTEIDRPRTAAFAIFGCLWMGAGQYFIYAKLLERWLPASDILSSSGKVMLDQFVHVPFVFMPIFCLTDGCVSAMTTHALMSGSDVVRFARNKYRREAVETLTENWKLWLPAQFVCFRYVQPSLRVPYVACVSFVWTMILSRLQGKFREE